jgi:hypothetical protein
MINELRGKDNFTSLENPLAFVKKGENIKTLSIHSVLFLGLSWIPELF